jgi:anti-sigma factor RsiW
MNCREIEEFLPLYLSGELQQDQRALFGAHLSECRSCAAEMKRQAATDVRVREALSAELPDSTSVEQTVRRRIARERMRRIVVAGAAAAALLFAAVLGYRALRPERLYTDAALDHRVEVMEHQRRHWRSDPEEIEKLAARYELSSEAARASLLAPQGYRLEHAKICGIDGAPALHMVYTNGVQEVSVYVRKRTGNEKGSGVHTVRVGSEHLAGFQTDRVEAVIVTSGSSGECLQFARFAAGVL